MLGGERAASVCRELTKTYEEFRRATLVELAQAYADATVKGEIVLVIGPPGEKEPDEIDIDALLLKLATDMPASKAAQEAARQTGLARSELYERLMALKG